MTEKKPPPKSALVDKAYERFLTQAVRIGGVVESFSLPLTGKKIWDSKCGGPFAAAIVEAISDIAKRAPAVTSLVFGTISTDDDGAMPVVEWLACARALAKDYARRPDTPRPKWQGQLGDSEDEQDRDEIFFDELDILREFLDERIPVFFGDAYPDILHEASVLNGCDPEDWPERAVELGSLCGISAAEVLYRYLVLRVLGWTFRSRPDDDASNDRCARGLVVAMDRAEGYARRLKAPKIKDSQRPLVAVAAVLEDMECPRAALLRAFNLIEPGSGDEKTKGPMSDAIEAVLAVVKDDQARKRVRREQVEVLVGPTLRPLASLAQAAS